VTETGRDTRAPRWPHSPYCACDEHSVAETTFDRRAWACIHALPGRFALVRVRWSCDRDDRTTPGHQLSTPSPADSLSYVCGDRVTETTARHPDTSYPRPPQPIRSVATPPRSSLARAREPACGGPRGARHRTGVSEGDHSIATRPLVASLSRSTSASTAETGTRRSKRTRASYVASNETSADSMMPRTVPESS